jgi:tetratricopeptide (TPR) repeat protein
VLLAAGMALCAFCTGGCDGSADEVTRLTGELKQSRQDNDGLVRELSDAHAETAGLNVQVKELTSANDDLGIEKELLTREVTRLNGRVRTLNEQLEDAVRKAAAARPGAAPPAQPPPSAPPQLRAAVERLDGLSQALFERGDYDAALSVGLTAEELGGATTGLFYRIGFCKAHTRDYAGANAWYARAAEVIGDEGVPALKVKLFTNWGIALAETGDKQAAAERYRRALEIDDSSAAAWFNLGLILAEDPDRTEEAIEAFRNHIIRGGGRGISARRHIAELQAGSREGETTAQDQD